MTQNNVLAVREEAASVEHKDDEDEVNDNNNEVSLSVGTV